jgi:hypothetical protein
MKLKNQMSILLIFTMCLSVTLSAQRPNLSRNNPQRPNVERVKAVRVALLTQKMNLSTEEAEKFWPVYNDYEKEQKKIREKFQPNKNIMALDDASVEKHLLGLLDMEEELVKMKKKYYQNFSKIIGYRKVAILAKSDREFYLAMIERLKNQPKRDN